VSTKLLKEWAHLSLAQRSMKLEQMFGVKVCGELLAHYYKRNGINYIKPQYAYLRKQAQREELTKHQQEVSLELAQHISQGQQIVYVDESSFHQWLVPSRAWVRRDTVLDMPSSRGSSVTIIGAISERAGLVHYKIVSGNNNAQEFKVFVQELVQKVRGDALVYMDNYTVHHSKVVKDFFNDRIQQRFFPPYSCALNPIEKLWMLVKGRWKRLMLERPDAMTEEEMVRELSEIIESFKDQCRGLANCHYQHIVRSLRGVFV